MEDTAVSAEEGQQGTMDVMQQCAQRIQDARRRYNIEGAIVIFEIGCALEAAFYECKSNNERFSAFLARVEVNLSARDARTYREFYREYKPQVEAHGQNFFEVGGLSPTGYRHLLRLPRPERSELLQDPESRNMTVSELDTAIKQLKQQKEKRENGQSETLNEPKVGQNDPEMLPKRLPKQAKERIKALRVTLPEVLSESPDEPDEGAQGVEVKADCAEIAVLHDEVTRLEEELHSFRAAFEFLTGGKSKDCAKDMKAIVDAVMDATEDKYRDLLATPVRKLTGYGTVRNYYEHMVKEE